MTTGARHTYHTSNPQVSENPTPHTWHQALLADGMTCRVSHATASSKARARPVTCSTRRFGASSDRRRQRASDEAAHIVPLLAVGDPRSQQPRGDGTCEYRHSKRYNDVELVGETPVRKREGRVSHHRGASFPTRHPIHIRAPRGEEEHVCADKSNNSDGRRYQPPRTTIHDLNSIRWPLGSTRTGGGPIT